MPSAAGHRELILADGSPTPRELADALRRGAASDADFDRFLPDPIRAVSRTYWTPLRVARRAAEWLDAQGVRCVLDIGSGSGKFCVAAALASRAQYVGFEQRPRLVAAARRLAKIFDVEDRVTFVDGTFGVTPTPGADAFYLFNPFGENLFSEESCLDLDVELGIERFRRDIAAVEQLLAHAPVGTCLVTYNGFGGRVPETYQAIHVERDLPSVLCLWRKVRRAPFTFESRFERPPLSL